MPNRTCPVCGKPATTLRAWLRGVSTLRTSCQNCGAALGGCAVVKLGLGVLLVGIIATVATVVTTLPTGASTPAYRYRELLPPVLACGAILYLLGGYVPVPVQKDRSPTSQGAGAGAGASRLDPAVPPGAVGFTRSAIVGAVSLALIIWAVAAGRRDLILALGRFPTTGYVTKVRPSAPGAVRGADHLVSYDYFDRSGTVRSGRDRLPGSEPAPEIDTTEVVHSAFDPSVSRLASRLSRIPVYALLLGVTLLAWSLLQVARTRRLRRWWRERRGAPA